MMKIENQVCEQSVKLTKKALSEFIQWSTSRYNDYCGYGNKKENVDMVYDSLKAGHFIGWGKPDETRTVFKIQCAMGVGENGNGRYWRVGGRKATDYEYEIDCINKTVTGLNSKKVIHFNQPQPTNY